MIITAVGRLRSFRELQIGTHFTFGAPPDPDSLWTVTDVGDTRATIVNKKGKTQAIFDGHPGFLNGMITEFKEIEPPRT